MIPKTSHVALLLSLLCACSEGAASSTNSGGAAQKNDPSPQSAAPQEAALPIELSSTRLAHLLDLGFGLYSGGMPTGAEAFEELAELGIKTIVNVDGARPAVDLAAAAGMEYVHIPIGYDGIPAEAVLALERVMRDSAKPIYFHCHHGKHRGPAAAAIALRIASGCSAEHAEAVLAAAGTSVDYKGLWRDVDNWVPSPAGTVLPELVSIAKVADYPAAMAKVDRVWDRVKLIRKAGWKAPVDHPDLVPSQETLILAQLLHDSASMVPAEFQEDRQFEFQAEASAEMADTLHQAIRGGDLELMEARYRDLATSCKDCHRDYRND